MYSQSAFEPYSAAPSSGDSSPTALAGTVAQGKGIFESHGCSGCHGASGGGDVGPALTQISSRFSAAQLTALLKAPTAKMKAGGMVALTLDRAELSSLVSYLASLGGAASTPVAAQPAPGPSPPAPTQAGSGSPAGPSKAATGSSPADATAASRGKGLFDSQRCSGCHGAGGAGGVGPALTHISSRFPPPRLTALLKAPTAKMKAAGMVPLTLNGADMKALVSYLTGLGKAATAPVAPPAGSASPAAPAGAAPANAGPSATAAQSKAESRGKVVFEAHRCADCHGTNGVGGTAAAPALAGTGKNFAPAQLTTMLEHPTARMQHGGMPAVSLSKKDLEALVAYVSSISHDTN